MSIPDDLTIEFTTDVFDFESELSDQYNAGNRFYGKDVAEYLCKELERFGVLCEFIDEDWGWLVMAHENTDPKIEICIYNWGQVDGPVKNLWRLRVNSSVFDRHLYFFRKLRYVDNSPNLVSALRAAFQGPEFTVTIFGASKDW